MNASFAPSQATADAHVDGMRGVLFQSLGEDSRSSAVERRLAEAIVSGMLQPGERLPAETELASMYQVSPSTIREALQSLRARDLVVTVRGRNGGSFVHKDADPLEFARASLRDASVHSLREIQTMHGVLFAGAVRLAARRATDDEIADLLERLDALEFSAAFAWRSAIDECCIALTALGQSARLTREFMRVQLELSSLLRLLDTDAATRHLQSVGLRNIVARLRDRDPAASYEMAYSFTRELIESLLRIRGSITANC